MNLILRARLSIARSGHSRLMFMGVAIIVGCLFLWTPISASASTVSVRDFGATGDGVTDDTAAIRAAAYSGSGPRTVVFPAGDYVFSSIYLKSDTAVVFQDGARGLSPIDASTSDAFFRAEGTVSSRTKNVSLTGGQFEGRPTIGAVFAAKYADWITVSNVTSTQTSRSIATEFSTNVTVSDCVANNARWGFAFEQSEYVTISGSKTQNTERDGILFYKYCKYVIATDNYVSNYMTEESEGVGGIQVYGSSEATITGNTVLNGQYDSAGIRFRDSNIFWCEDNYVGSPGSSGFQVHRVGDYPGFDGGDGTFVSNTVVGAKLRGFDVQNPLSKAVSIIDNLIINTTSLSPVSAGMGIVAAPKDSVVVGNHVRTASGAGIQVGGSGQLVAWNDLRNVGSVNFGPRVGVFVTGTGHAVVGNEVVDDFGNIVNGVRVYTGGSALLRDNSVVGQSGEVYDNRGVQLSSARSDATAPVVSASLEAMSDGQSRVSLAASDGGSGVVAVAVSVDGGRKQVFAGASTIVLLNGAHWVTCFAVDAAGNVGSTTVYGTPISDRTFDRVWGDSRYTTSVAVSKAAYPAGAPVVLIATGRDYPDALVGAVLARAEDGPLLLVSSVMPAEVIEEINRLKPAKAIILGGEGSVSVAVEAELKGLLGAGNVDRLAGSNRYDTARLIAEAVRAKLGSIPSATAVVASGASFPDALAVSPLAASKGWPILLTAPNSLSSATSGALDSLGITNSLVVGGENAVSPSVMVKLPAPMRIGGSNRYSTAALVADHARDEGLRYSYVALATGENFPDALSGAVLTAENNGLLFLTPANELHDSVVQRLKDNKSACEGVEVYGGATAIHPSVAASVQDILR